MKKLMYFLLIALSVSLVACKKDDVADGPKITYKATQKLPEAGNDKEDGLYLGGFGAKCTSHVYDEATQTGTLVFANNPIAMHNAFSGCKDLISVDLPKTITAISSNAFKNSGIKNFTFPDWITKIEVNAFAGSEIESIIIPETITEMGSSVFEGCKKLTEVYFSNEIDMLPVNTFKNCKALTTVVLPENCDKIGGYAFFSCSALPSIIIPFGITAIESFAFNGCSALATVTCKTPLPPTIDKTTCFAGIPAEAKLYVPSIGLNPYKLTGNWTYFFKADNILPIAD